MGYSLKRGEAIDAGMRRMAGEQADKALNSLKSRPQNRDDAIHDARVCFKKIRAVLRLMRHRLNGDFDRENTFYRDQGRRLSEVRNKVAMGESLGKLKSAFGDQLSAKALRTVKTEITKPTAQEKREKAKAIGAVNRALRSGRRRIEKWKFGKVGFGAIAEGLTLTYRQGRQQFSLATKKPSVENLHEWRKRVKDLWYQARILKKIWPGEMESLAKELQTLGDYLSDHHDLALLREKSADDWKKIEGQEIDTLAALIDQRLADLRLRARLLGERIYAEKPAALSRRMRHYWRAWREEGKARPAATEAKK